MEYFIIALLAITIILLIVVLLLAKKIYDARPVDDDSKKDEWEEELEEMNGRLEKVQVAISNESTAAGIHRQNLDERFKNQSEGLSRQLNDGFRIVFDQNKSANETAEKTSRQAYEQQNLLIKGSSELTRNQLTGIQESINKNFTNQGQMIQERYDAQGSIIQERFAAQAKLMQDSFNTQAEIMNTNFAQIRKENNEQIDKIRESVNEKLEKTLNDQFDRSFKGLMEQMTQLTTTMGELKGISNQVGTLEKALNGVKTRGIIGERQLKLLIQDVLSPNQYDVEVATFPGSNDHVEVAIKLPDRNTNDFYYLPVDSKCHIDKYENLVNALQLGNPQAIDDARKELRTSIRDDAKKISNKYIKEPYTTPYAILFVPFEGMYSEIVNLNLLDELNKMNITVVGPYTMMAVLSTIVNYWQALAIEKKSKDIEKTLSATKSAFSKFDDQLKTVRRQLDTATKSLDTLQTTRTNVVLKALKGVSELAEGETNPLLADSGNDLFLLDGNSDSD